MLHARGTELEREYPLGVARQCLEHAVRQEGDRERLLHGAARLAGPVLLDVPEEVGTTPVGILHGLYWLVANLADEAPLLLAVDDAHWADEPSLRFLAYVARRAESLPIALVIGARPEGDASVLTEIGAEPGTARIEPRALGLAGVGRLLREIDHGPVDDDFTQDDRDAPHAHLSQARHPAARPARAGPGSGSPGLGSGGSPVAGTALGAEDGAMSRFLFRRRSHHPPRRRTPGPVDLGHGRPSRARPGVRDGHDPAAGRLLPARGARTAAMSAYARVAALPASADPRLRPLLEQIYAKLGSIVEQLRAGDSAGGARRFVEEVALGPGACQAFPPEVHEQLLRNVPAFLGDADAPDWGQLELAPIGCPVLITSGSESPRWLQEIARFLARRIPGAHRRELAGAGHLPHETHPERYAALIEEFVASASGTRAA